MRAACATRPSRGVHRPPLPAISAAPAMDRASRRRRSLREGLQYADAIEQSHCRPGHVDDRGPARLGGRPLGRGGRAARHGSSIAAAPAGVSARSTSSGSWRWAGRADEARRWLEESLATGRRIGDPVRPPASGPWPTDPEARAEGQGPLRGGARPRCRDGRACAADPVRRDRDAGAHRGTAPERCGAPSPGSGNTSTGGSRLAARRSTTRTGWSASWPDRSRRRARPSSGRSAAGRSAAVPGRQRGPSLDLAQCLIRMNRHGDAIGLVTEVQREAQSLGSEPLLARAVELGRASRGRGRR